MSKYEGLKNQPFWEALKDCDMFCKKQLMISSIANLSKQIEETTVNRDQIDQITELVNKIKSIIS